jgi:hypothetical protein
MIKGGMENQEQAAEVTDGPATYDQLEEYFIQEGQWLEGQANCEAETYNKCPICSGLPNVFKIMAQAIQGSLEKADKMLNDGHSSEEAADFLAQEKTWYELTKTITSELVELSHKPEQIMRAHPELAVTKATRRQIKSGKNRRKMAKESRRKNRR